MTTFEGIDIHPSRNPATVMREIVERVVQRPLTNEENARFDEMERYCDESISSDAR